MCICYQLSYGESEKNMDTTELAVWVLCGVLKTIYVWGTLVVRNDQYVSGGKLKEKRWSAQARGSALDHMQVLAANA